MHVPVLKVGWTKVAILFSVLDISLMFKKFIVTGERQIDIPEERCDDLTMIKSILLLYALQ